MTWIPVLLLGRFPGWGYRWIGGLLGWGIRVQAYLGLLTPAYPPFSLSGEDHPVSVRFDEGVRINRLWGVPVLGILVRAILLIPHFIVLWLLAILVGFLWLFTWLGGALPGTPGGPHLHDHRWLDALEPPGPRLSVAHGRSLPALLARRGRPAAVSDPEPGRGNGAPEGTGTPDELEGVLEAAEATLSRKPEVDYLLVADRAEVVNGKLYLMGGSWDRVQPPSFPHRMMLGIALGVRIPFAHTDDQHTVAIELSTRTPAWSASRPS